MENNNPEQMAELSRIEYEYIQALECVLSSVTSLAVDARGDLEKPVALMEQIVRFGVASERLAFQRASNMLDKAAKMVGDIGTRDILSASARQVTRMQEEAGNRIEVKAGQP